MLAGEGLHPSSKGKRVKFSGASRTVTDGPFTETKELIAGFWIWRVKSMDEAVDWLKRKRAPFEFRVGHLIARLFFRGIYFPQMSRRAWLRLIADNQRVIYKLVKEAAVSWRKARRKSADVSVEARAS